MISREELILKIAKTIDPTWFWNEENGVQPTYQDGTPMHTLDNYPGQSVIRQQEAYRKAEQVIEVYETCTRTEQYDEWAVTPAEKAILVALERIWQYGGIDGEHHKKWVLDQVVRALCLHEQVYQTWLAQYRDGSNSYEWDEGIAP